MTVIDLPISAVGPPISVMDSVMVCSLPKPARQQPPDG
jgi:hypothetical protein